MTPSWRTTRRARWSAPARSSQVRPMRSPTAEWRFFSFVLSLSVFPRSSPRERGPSAYFLDGRFRGHERTGQLHGFLFGGLGIELLRRIPEQHAAAQPGDDAIEQQAEQR